MRPAGGAIATLTLCVAVGILAMLAACGSDPNAPGAPADHVDVYAALTIRGETYPFAFAANDTLLYHTLVLDRAGSYRSWCEVSRGGMRGVECRGSGTWENVSDRTIQLLSDRGEILDVAVDRDTLRWDGDGGLEVHVRCAELGTVPCQTTPP